jgi:hypothetical protein
VHAPTKSVQHDEAKVAGMLAQLPLWARTIVTHPDALRNPRNYRVLGTRVILENMDTRKDIGRTAEEMDRFFSLVT